MTPRELPPAPPWYRLEVPTGLDGAARFMFGPPPPMSDDVRALAYRIGVMPGAQVRATRSGWHFIVERRVPSHGAAARRRYNVPVPFDRPWVEVLAAAVLEVAGEPDHVRDLLEHPAYLAGNAAIVFHDADGRRCAASISSGRAGVRVAYPSLGDGTLGDMVILAPPSGDDLDSIADLVDLVEPRSERLARWRDRGDS